jgi:hypothetical protein
MIANPAVSPVTYMKSASSLEQKLSVVAAYERVAGAPVVMESCFDLLKKQYPNSPEVQIAFALERLKDQPALRLQTAQELEKFISSHKLSEHIASLLQTYRAYLLLKSNKIEQANLALQKISDQNSDHVLRLRIEILTAMRKCGDALQWCDALMERHRSTQNILVVINTLWSFQKYAEAATLIRENISLLPLQTWDVDVARIVDSVFSDKSRNQRAAINALVTAGFTDSNELATLARGLYAVGNTELAFDVCDASTTSNSADKLTWMYSCLREFRGQAAALAWLSKRVPKYNDRIDFAVPAFISGADELLWDFIAEQPDGANSEMVWLLRSALVSKPSQKQAVLLKNAIAHKESSAAKLTSYMMGMQSEASILTMPWSDDDLCRAAFCVGWKHLRDGSDLRLIFKYWRIAMESRSQVDERAWAERWTNLLQRLFNSSTIKISDAMRFVQVGRREGAAVIGRDFKASAAGSASYGGGRYLIFLRRVANQKR